MARDLGIVGLSFFLICNIVGAGVFFLQKVILVNTESVYLSLFCWIFAAFIAILFGLCYSELGSKYPEEGGDVVYFNKAYGSVACVIFSIVSMFVILPLGCALMLQLICHTINSDKTIGSYVTMPLIIVVISLCNWFGSTIIVKVQQFITILKVIVVTIFVVLSACVFTGFIKKVGGGTCAMNAPPTGANTFYGIMVAMFSTLWSFDGWNAGNFIAHRIQNPRRTLPIAITASVIIVSLLYLAINISFFSVLSCDTIKNSNRPLVYNYFYSLAINDYAKKFLTAFVSIIPSLGTLNGSFIVVMSILDGLTGNRENKQAYKLGGLMLFALVTFLAGLMDNPDKIISNISFCVYLFYGMSIYAITILRKQERVDKRIFKAPIFVVYSCVGISAAVVGFSLYKSILG